MKTKYVEEIESLLIIYESFISIYSIYYKYSYIETLINIYI